VGTKQMGKSSKKISSIKIQNFKIFKELNVNNLKRVNLIGGKNNIGKTAFLEAVEFFASSNNIYDVVINIARLVLKRQNKNRDYQNEIEFDLINYDSDSFIIKVDQNELIVKLIGPEFNQDIDIYIDNEEIIPEQLVEITFNQDIHKFPIRKLLHRRVLPPYRENVFKPKVNFISSSTINERDIATFYGELVDLGKENFLDNSLKLFDEKFIALKQKATKKDIILKLKIKDRDKPILLSSLGEGINRFVAILCAIWASN
jgi:AAA15 family ATPase/GTPase